MALSSILAYCGRLQEILVAVKCYVVYHTENRDIVSSGIRNHETCATNTHVDERIYSDYCRYNNRLCIRLVVSNLINLIAMNLLMSPILTALILLLHKFPKFQIVKWR